MTRPSASSSPRRINVRGTTGAGKTHLSAMLAEGLGVPHIELDALHWGPGWAEPSPEAFRATVREVLDANPQGWVIDGSYDSKLGDMVTGAADTIVWLDLPLTVSLFRLLRRTVRRVFVREELWNGNLENWREQFASRESIFVWAVNAHHRHRRAWHQRFTDDPRLVRLRTRADVARWSVSLGGECETSSRSGTHPRVSSHRTLGSSTLPRRAVSRRPRAARRQDRQNSPMP